MIRPTLLDARSPTLKSVASRIAPPEQLRAGLNALVRRFGDNLRREQELQLESGLDLDLDSDLEFFGDPDVAVDHMVAQFGLGYEPERIFDTLPVYNVCFHLRRHPQTGIFHSSNALELAIGVTGAGAGAGRTLDLFVELIGGNFPRDTVGQQECCLRLRCWTMDNPVFFRIIFWPDGGCLVDEDGKQVPIENEGYLLGPEDDTTLEDDRIEEVALPADIDQAWAEGRIQPGDVHQAWHDTCSSFDLPAGSRPPTFATNGTFSLPTAGANGQRDLVDACIRKWRGAGATGSVLPQEAVQRIMSHAFPSLDECYSFSGTLALAVGLGPAKKAHHSEDDGEEEDEEEGRRCRCGRPGVSWLGGMECADCFDEH